MASEDPSAVFMQASSSVKNSGRGAGVSPAEDVTAEEHGGPWFRSVFDAEDLDLLKLYFAEACILLFATEER